MRTLVSFVAMHFVLFCMLPFACCASLSSIGHVDLLRFGARSNNSVACNIQTHHPDLLQRAFCNQHTLHCTTLRSTTLHYITLHCIALHYTTLHYMTLQYTTSHYTTLHSTTLHCIPQHCIALDYITFTFSEPNTSSTCHIILRLQKGGVPNVVQCT